MLVNDPAKLAELVAKLIRKEFRSLSSARPAI
jgi:hypothetical protein